MYRIIHKFDMGIGMRGNGQNVKGKKKK